MTTMLEEIAIEIAMIAATLVAAGCLIYLVALTVLEQYVLRTRRDRRPAARPSTAPAATIVGSSAPAALRQGHA